MKLGGQGERGYAMATLLVGMALMAILMTAALPAWTQLAQREKETEYLFRANQYALAIKRFQNKMGGTAGNGQPAPSVDFLIEQKFLRKRYKDPLTGKDFLPLLNNQVAGAQPIQNGQAGSTFGQPAGQGAPGQQQQTPPKPSSLATGKSLATDTLKISASEDGRESSSPLTGVTSASKATALRLFKGQSTTYDQWAVTAQDVGLHLGGYSVGSRFAQSNAGSSNPPPQLGGQGTSPFGQGASPFGQPQGTGGFGAPAGMGGFGQPNQQGTPVLPPPPTGSKPPL